MLFYNSMSNLLGCAGTVNGVQGSLQMLFQSLSYVAGLFIWQPQVGGCARSRTAPLTHACCFLCFIITAKWELRHSTAGAQEFEWLMFGSCGVVTLAAVTYTLFVRAARVRPALSNFDTAIEPG